MKVASLPRSGASCSFACVTWAFSSARCRPSRFRPQCFPQSALEDDSIKLVRTLRRSAAPLPNWSDWWRRERLTLSERTVNSGKKLWVASGPRAALLQAQKIEALGQLVGGVAHDFNNLLMAVIGNLDLLSKKLGEDARLHRLLDGAMEGARRGATLTQRLLAFARKQELKAQTTDVRSLVEDMIGLFRRPARAPWKTGGSACRRADCVGRRRVRTSASRISSIVTGAFSPAGARNEGQEAIADASDAQDARMARFSETEARDPPARPSDDRRRCRDAAAR